MQSKIPPCLGSAVPGHVTMCRKMSSSGWKEKSNFIVANFFGLYIVETSFYFTFSNKFLTFYKQLLEAETLTTDLFTLSLTYSHPASTDHVLTCEGHAHCTDLILFL